MIHPFCFNSIKPLNLNQNVFECVSREVRQALQVLKTMVCIWKVAKAILHTMTVILEKGDSVSSCVDHHQTLEAYRSCYSG